MVVSFVANGHVLISARERVIQTLWFEGVGPALVTPALSHFADAAPAQSLIADFALTLAYAGYAYAFHCVFDRVRPVVPLVEYSRGSLRAVRTPREAAFLRVRRRSGDGRRPARRLDLLPALTKERTMKSFRTMKSVNTLRRTAGIAAAVAGIALAAPVFGITATSNLLGTPDDGMICRSGYAGALSGSAFKCSKVRTITVQLECTDPRFPNYLIRANAPGTPQGRDLCLRNNVSLGSTDPVGNLVEGQDYVRANVNAAAVANRVSNLDQQEASALGLDTKGVDTVAADAVILPNAGSGSKDNATVQVTHYTFAIKTGAPIAASK